MNLIPFCPAGKKHQVEEHIENVDRKPVVSSDAEHAEAFSAAGD